MNKPNPGIEPQWYWREQRCKELVEMSEKYKDRGMDTPVEWVDEIIDHIRWLMNFVKEPKS